MSEFRLRARSQAILEMLAEGGVMCNYTGKQYGYAYVNIGNVRIDVHIRLFRAMLKFELIEKIAEATDTVNMRLVHQYQITCLGVSILQARYALNESRKKLAQSNSI